MEVVQRRVHLVVFQVAERIVLVRMALRALRCNSQDGFADRVHAIKHGFDAKLLRIRSAFFVHH